MRPSRSLSHVSLFVPGGASDASSQDDASPACEPSWLPSSSQDDASPACEPSWPISWPSFALREARSPPFVWIVQAVRRNPNVEERLTSRLDCGLEVRTYGELHALRSRDLNRLAGARVAPHTGLALGT